MYLMENGLLINYLMGFGLVLQRKSNLTITYYFVSYIIKMHIKTFIIIR